MEQITIEICQVFTYKYVDFSMNRTKIYYHIYYLCMAYLLMLYQFEGSYSIRLHDRMNDYIH